MDNAGMVAMFEAMVESGLKGFLSCSSAIFETALVEFFHNASVRDGMVVSTVLGKPVAISEELFASTFALPLKGLTDFHEVPQDFVPEARRAFSYEGKLISTSCKNRELVFEFRLLSDILAKSVTVKVGSFDAVTHERFLMMSAIFRGVKVNWGRLLFNIFKDMVTLGSRQAGYAVQICILLKNVPNLELGNSKVFPPLKVLAAKTVSRNIAINKQIAVEDVDDDSRVKKTPVKKAVSKKRPATASDIIEPISTVSAEQLHKPKRKAPKRKLKLPEVSDDEIVDKEADVENVVEKQSDEPSADVVVKEPAVETIAEKLGETSVDDVDSIIEQILADTAQFETDIGEPEVTDFEEPVNSKAYGITVGDTVCLVAAEGQQLQGTETEEEAVTTADDLLSIEEHLAQIPDNLLLPFVIATDITQIRYSQGIEIREVDLHKASLPKSLILTKEMNLLRSNFVSGTPTTTIDLNVLELLTATHHFALKVLLRQVQEHKLEWTRPYNSLLFEGTNIVRSYFIPRNHRTIFSGSVHDHWAEVCVGVVQFSLIGSLRSAHKINRCRTIFGSLIDIEEIPIGFRGFFQRGLNTNSFATFLDVFVDQPEGQVLPEDESSYSDVSIVYRSPSIDAEPRVQISLVVDIISVPTDSVHLTPRNSDISLSSPHQSSSSASSMHFSDDILQDDDNAIKQILESPSAAPVDQIPLPTASITVISESLAELRASISRISVNHMKDSRRLGDSQSEFLSKINHLEKALLDALYQQDQAFQGLIKSVRKEAQNQADVFSIKVVEAILSRLRTIRTEVEEEMTGADQRDIPAVEVVDLTKEMLNIGFLGKISFKAFQFVVQIFCT
ncbi:hypothetical protein F511_06692 [Dorcoceras hygrometricum]|uniref:Dystroglycan-like n=1 Tax=Dorcoceras hygrometricum TaxID=472368 RepID=A0A2Z7BQH0_9LAMI|nr:hypothetical protein F511_06692 [Dorcoceras hygrometricum]